MRMCASLLWVLAASAAVAADVSRVESWPGADTAGWQTYDLVLQKAASLTNSGSALRITYATQSIKMPPEEHWIMAEASASAGAFCGDYRAAGARGVSVRVRGDKPAQARLMIRNLAQGNQWSCPFLMPTGAWGQVTVPLTASQWQRQGEPGTPADFEVTLGHIDGFGVAVIRDVSLQAQSYWLDDVALSAVDPRFRTWMAQYGVASDLEPGDDLDHDGVSNYEEWIAGTSAAKDNEYLMVTGVQLGDSSGFVLRWPSVAGRRYQVLRAMQLGGAFDPIGSELTATPPQNEYTDDIGGAGPYFYRVEVHYDE